MKASDPPPLTPPRNGREPGRHCARHQSLVTLGGPRCAGRVLRRSRVARRCGREAQGTAIEHGADGDRARANRRAVGGGVRPADRAALGREPVHAQGQFGHRKGHPLARGRHPPRIGQGPHRGRWRPAPRGDRRRGERTHVARAGHPDRRSDELRQGRGRRAEPRLDRLRPTRTRRCGRSSNRRRRSSASRSTPSRATIRARSPTSISTSRPEP